MYRQCELRRKDTMDVAWIPEEFARIGKWLRIRGENAWQVVRVGENRKSQQYLLEHERDWMYQREASDI